ncbi:MAG TPA: excinuclease ABC subunit C [Flavobacteriales bacterium]|nr:excinuclease ABC subunit C [Flavobacteriales bacterium]
MKFFTYIIYSSITDRYYIGVTSNISERLAKHNTNHKGYTGNANDWILEYYEEFQNKTFALKREKQLKSWKSRERIKELISKSYK